jgi:catechol 2,3-dioxygenase-like lactoylglutathione lyase family enzyme
VGSNELARRFLHVNLNCDSLDATERVYCDVLGLTARMRTDPNVATDGTILGLDGETYCTTAFLYDARGGRGGCALEAIEYRLPPLADDPSIDATRPGIRSVLLAVADVDGAAAALRGVGLTVGDPVDGLICDGKAVLAIDHNGVVIELTELPSDADAGSRAMFDGIRINAIDATATGTFLTAIGFQEIEAPQVRPVAGAQLSPGGSAEALDCVVARYALPEDRHQFTVVVVQHPSTAPRPCRGAETARASTASHYGSRMCTTPWLKCPIPLSASVIRCGARCQERRSRGYTSRSCAPPTAWSSSSSSGHWRISIRSGEFGAGTFCTLPLTEVSPCGLLWRL